MIVTNTTIYSDSIVIVLSVCVIYIIIVISTSNTYMYSCIYHFLYISINTSYSRINVSLCTKFDNDTSCLPHCIIIVVPGITVCPGGAPIYSYSRSSTITKTISPTHVYYCWSFKSCSRIDRFVIMPTFNNIKAI